MLAISIVLLPVSVFCVFCGELPALEIYDGAGAYRYEPKFPISPIS